jgi:uncharacterized protein YbjT (DUF2867 family)
MKPLIVVVGATGQQGGSVVDALVATNEWTIRGLTRDRSSQRSQVYIDELENQSIFELFDIFCSFISCSHKALLSKGVDVVTCNIDSYEQCLQAFHGAYGVYAMTNYWEQGATNEYEQGMNMVRAARYQHVQHFIWSSLPNSLAISNGKLDLPHYM